MPGNSNSSKRESDAVFYGWQEVPWGAPVALYNITAVDHPSYGSTVSEVTLRALNLQIPQVPLHRGEAQEAGSSAAAESQG
jgi:hypothetical protein